VFGSVTTGASDDLRRVADIARAMVRDYAMGTGFTSMRAVENASESTQRHLDEEARELADEAFRAATGILDTHRAKLDELADTLLTNEVLERTDIDRIMHEVPAAAPRRVGELSVAAATAVNPARRPGQK
jgi:cell division protease FtsH